LKFQKLSPAMTPFMLARFETWKNFRTNWRS
jgi:hypothetical protein